MEQTIASFLSELQSLVERQTSYSLNHMLYKVSPDLYALWAATSFVSCELFADSVNESGVLRNYCSIDKRDSVFGACGSWEATERTVMSGAANPPFTVEFLRTVIGAFERGAMGRKPYCRCAVLPLADEYGVLSALDSPTSAGALLVSIP